MDQRVNKINYYLDIAQTVAERSTCIRRHFGAIIVKNDVIVSTGYNGAPRGRVNCSDTGVCLRDRFHVPHGERYELCRSVHAEANAIISASREEMLDATLYMACVNPADGSLFSETCSCSMCKRLIINACIKQVIIRDDREHFRVIDVRQWVKVDDFEELNRGY